MEKGIATFKERQGTENLGILKVKDYFAELKETVSIIGAPAKVQIEMDIDFIWEYDNGVKTIEVKVDTQGHETGNFAFETVSNEIKGTPGCFMRSKADLLAYFFVESGELYVFNFVKTREWFIKELSSRPNRFRGFLTHTDLGNGNVYPSHGRLVPVLELLNTTLPIRKVEI
jgi:hypothetical protein